jgi:hypothetical protein
MRDDLSEQPAVADPRIAALERRQAAVGQRDPQLKPDRRYRKGLAFVRESDHCRPLDRNDRARILFVAQNLERRSKEKGKKNGALGYTGLLVLRALILAFANVKTGLCCPSFTAIMLSTGLCRQAVSDALHRLEATKLVSITRRLVRERITRTSPITGLLETFVQAVQGTNLYSFNVPGENAVIPLPWRTTRRRAKFAGVQPESANTTENKQPMAAQRTPCLQVAAALDKLAQSMGYKGLFEKELVV